MSLNPENENKNGIEEQATAPDTQANESENTAPQESTIFVKHVYNTKKPAQNGSKKRIIICITAGVLCAAITVGAIFGSKYWKSDDVTSTPSTVEEETITVLKKGDIIKDSTVTLDGEEVTVDTNIESVYFVNGYDEFKFLNQFVKAETEEGDTTSATSSTSSASSSTSTTSSSTKTEYLYDTEWYIEGIDRKKTDSEAILDKIEECLTINAFREIKNTFDTVDEYHEHYGMKDKLTAGCVITFNDGTDSLTVSVGDALATYDSYYLMTSLSDTVYAVKSDYAEYFFCSSKEFANPNVISPIVKTDDNSAYFNTSNQLARFDKIKIYGDVFGDEIYEFTMNKGVSADYMPYRMTAPYERPASDEFLSNVLGFAQDGLQATVLYSYAATENDLKECGLDNPKGFIELTVGDYSYKLTIGGSRNDGTESLTAMVNGSDMVFGIDQDDLAFLINASNDITTMFNQFFIMEDIYTIKSVEFGVDSGDYKFDLKHTQRSEDEEVYDTEVKLSNTVMNTQSFKLIYQRVLMLTLLEFVIEAEEAEPILTVTINFIGDSEPRVVEFTESPDDMYHYIAWVDGTPLGEVLKSSLDDILECIDIYLDGGEVPDTW